MGDAPEVHLVRLADIPAVIHPGRLADGIYFNLPFSEYLAEKRLSKSLMRWLKIDPYEFWARSWMNPDKEEDEETAFTELGQAYHVRICEGRESFYRQYAEELNPADYPDALFTAEHLRAELERRDLKKGGNKPDLIARLLDDDPTTQIWDVLENRHREANPERTFLAFKQIARIERAAAMIEKSPMLGKVFTGGYPEVSILWTDPGTNTPMKVRIDYLKIRALVELKSYGNQNGRPIDRAIYQAMANYRYHIGAALYLEGVRIAKSLAHQGHFFGEVDPAWLRKFCAQPEHEFLFLFQSTGPAPIARGWVFPQRSMHQIGMTEARNCIELFAQCMEKFGPDIPWISDAPWQEFDDLQFPSWAAE